MTKKVEVEYSIDNLKGLELKNLFKKLEGNQGMAIREQVAIFKVRI